MVNNNNNITGKNSIKFNDNDDHLREKSGKASSNKHKELNSNVANAEKSKEKSFYEYKERMNKANKEKK